jgi:hypothetical protein
VSVRAARMPAPTRVAGLVRAPAVREVGIALGFLALACLTTWPWVRDMWSQASIGDGTVYTWNFWWVPHRILEGGNPWFTRDLFAPVGSHLGLGTTLLFPGLLAAPLTLTAGAVISFNVSVLLWLAAAGYLAYRLALPTLRSRAAALCAGALYGAAPTVVYRTEALFNILTAAVLVPAALMAARRMARRRSVWSALVLGAVVAAAILSDQTCGIFVLGSLVGYWAYALLVRPGVRRRRMLVLGAVAAATALVLAAPQLYESLRARDVAGSGITEQTRVGSAMTYSADVAQLILPSPQSRFFAGAYDSAARGLGSLAAYRFDGVKAIGWGILILALVGSLAPRRPRWVRLAWVGAAVCVVLSLGPTLRIAGHQWAPVPVHLADLRVSALMPYTWLLNVPVLQDLRVPERILVVALLPLALLAARGAQALWRRNALLAIPVAGLVALTAIEGAVPLTGFLSVHDSRFTDPIRRDRSDSIVVDVPVGMASGAFLVGAVAGIWYAQIRAVDHHHPILNGFNARVDVARTSALANRPFPNALIRLQDGTLVQPTERLPVVAATVRRDARAMGVGWVVIWPGAGGRIEPFLRRLGFTAVVRGSVPSLLGPKPAVLMRAPWIPADRA